MTIDHEFLELEGKGSLVSGCFELHECTGLFFLGSVHAGISPSTVMNNFILHRTGFCHKNIRRVITIFHLCINDVTGTEATF